MRGPLSEVVYSIIVILVGVALWALFLLLMKVSL